MCIRDSVCIVLDGQKLADKEKLAWIRHGLEEDADIETFCITFLDIFADQYTTATAQKKTVVRLWCMHKGRKVITATVDLSSTAARSRQARNSDCGFLEEIWLLKNKFRDSLHTSEIRWANATNYEKISDGIGDGKNV